MTANRTSTGPALYRRLLREDPRTAGYPADPAGATDRLRGAGVIVADNVADFFYGPDAPEHWYLARNLLTLLPRGVTAAGGDWFIEWRMPMRCTSERYGTVQILSSAVLRHGYWLNFQGGPEVLRDNASVASTLTRLGYARRARWIVTVRCFEMWQADPVFALPETGYLPLDQEGRVFSHDGSDLLVLQRRAPGAVHAQPSGTGLDLIDLLPLAALVGALSRCANVSLIPHDTRGADRWHTLSIDAGADSADEQIPAGQFAWSMDGGDKRRIWQLRPR